MFFVDDDQSGIGQRREHGRARANHDIHRAGANAVPLVVALAVGQPTVLDGHGGTKAGAKERRHLRREGNFRHQHQHAAPAPPDRIGQPQIHLGLAAAGHTVDQRHPKSLRGRQRQQLLHRHLLLVGQRPARAALIWRVRADGVLEGIAVDTLGTHGDVAQRRQSRDSCGGDATLCEFRRRPAVRRTLQQHQGLLLLATQGRAIGQVIVTGATRMRDQPIDRIKAGGGERHYANGLEAVHPVGQAVRWQRGRQRGAGSGEVVLRDPLGELDDVWGDEGIGIEHLDDVLHLEGDIDGPDVPHDDASQLARPQWHNHARARHGHDLVGRDAISEEAERGHRHRDGDETVAHVVPTRRPGEWRAPASCRPTLRASPRDCAAGRRGGTSGSRWCRDSRTGARAGG